MNVDGRNVRADRAGRILGGGPRFEGIKVYHFSEHIVFRVSLVEGLDARRRALTRDDARRTSRPGTTRGEFT
jgi:hypothetical protein